MLIAKNNQSSLSLAKSLNYHIEDYWDFYSVTPEKIVCNSNVKKITKNQSIIDLILTHVSSYVRSWRWLPLTKNIIENLCDENKIFVSEKNNIINGIAISLESDHFDKTIMITIVYGNEIGLENIIKYFQNFALENNIERIQILSKIKDLPKKNNLEKKYTFCLLKKKLS